MTSILNLFHDQNHLMDVRFEIYLLRHGQTDWNVQKRYLGRSDLGLNTTGIAQAKRLGLAFKSIELTAVISSPLARATETAQILAAHHGLIVKTETGLKELDHGDLEGHFGVNTVRTHPTFTKNWAKNPATTRLPNGETVTECRDRAMRSLESITQEYSATNGPIAIVSHQTVLCAILATLMKLPLNEFKSIKQENGAINLVTMDRVPHTSKPGLATGFTTNLKVHIVNNEHIPAI